MESPRNPGLAARLFGGRPEHTLALLRAAWPEAVGEELARRSEVVALDGGVLRVRVPDLRWQRTLLRMRGMILARLRQVAGPAAPRTLGFVTGEVTPPAETIPPAPASSPPPTPPALVLEAAGAIPDPEIRARFLATASRYLGRFGTAQAASDASPGAAPVAASAGGASDAGGDGGSGAEGG